MKNKLLLIFAFWGMMGAVAVGQVFTCDSLKLTVMGNPPFCLGESITLAITNNNIPPATDLMYSWEEDGILIGTDNPLSHTPSSPGMHTYAVTVTYSSDTCTQTISATTLAPPNLTGQNIAATNITCNDLSDGSITIEIAPQGSVYGYRIREADAFEANNFFSGLQADYYTVQVKDPDGCESNIVQQEIEDPAQLTASTNITQKILCKGGLGTIEVTAQGGTGTRHYQIKGSGAVQNSPIFSNLKAGIYAFVITDANGCSVTTAPDTLTPKIAIRASASVSVPIRCFGEKGTITLTALPDTLGYKYRQLPNVAYDTTRVFKNLPKGSYTFEVMDTISNCTVTDTILLAQPDSLTFSTIVTAATCKNNGIIKVSPTGGTGPYKYSIDGGTSFQTESMFSTVDTGQHIIVVRDSLLCESAPDTIHLGSSYVSLSLMSQENVKCKGGSDGSFKVKAVNGVETQPYTFSNGSQTQSGSSGVEVEFLGLKAGLDTVIVTDQSGCMDTVSVNITEPPPLTVTITPTQPTKCTEKGEAEANVQGGTVGMLGYQYLWSNGGTTQKISNLAQGDYTVTVTDGNKCTVTQSVSIVPVDAPVVKAELKTPSNCNSATGKAIITITGGMGPFDLFFKPPMGQLDTFFNVLSLEEKGGLKGGYRFYIKDKNECITSDTLFVPDFDKPIINVMPSDPYCGQSNGTATAEIQFSSSPISTYAWTGTTFSGSKSGTPLSSLSAGTYTVVVIDQNNCKDTATTTLTGTNLDQFLSTSPDASICQGDNHTFSVTNTPLPTGWTYAWTPVAPASGTVGSAKDYTISPPNPGNYQYKLVVTDGSVTGTVCKGEKIVALQVKSRPMPTGGADLPLCIKDSVLLDPKTTGTDLAYQWVPASSKPTFQAKAPGSYTVTVTNTTTTCTATATFTVAEKGVLPSPVEKYIHKSPGKNNILLYPDSDPALCYLWGHIENGVEIPADPIQDKQHWFLGTGYMASRKYFVKIRLKENGACDPCAYTQTEHTILPDAAPSTFSALLLPNPNDGDFWLDIRLEQPEALSVQVLDVLGRPVADHQEPAGITDFRLPLRLSNTLSPGLYQVRLSGADGRRLGLMPMVLTK